MNKRHRQGAHGAGKMIIQINRELFFATLSMAFLLAFLLIDHLICLPRGPVRPLILISLSVELVAVKHHVFGQR
jgi:hypothetical protein